MITPKNSFPVFVVKNLKETKEFYTSHLSFNTVFENEWYIHLVSETGIQIGFLLPDQPTQPEMFHSAYSGRGALFSLEVENAEAAFSYAESASLKITLELRSEEWGQKHFCIEDPNGLQLDIVEATEPSEEYKAGFTE